MPSNPGQLVKRLPSLDSVFVAASENLDAPKKHQTRLGWIGPSSKCELGTPMSFQGSCAQQPWPARQEAAQLGSVSVAASENLDVPKKHQTSLGWVGPAWS